MTISLNSEQLPMEKQPLILAVDDNEDSLTLLIAVLELYGCIVITATEGSKALALAESYQPDLILLDLILPDLNGETVISHLKQNSKTSQIPIIATTGLARTADQEYFLKLGCTHYLIKPYIIDELEKLLSLYLNEN
ncbi:response regulator [Allocoleopsis sp.]|uniref:response regulator n=1 Tax=Allocoleopsis sp. TaxID=3088169 RepID=UPI002FD052F8